MELDAHQPEGQRKEDRQRVISTMTARHDPELISEIIDGWSYAELRSTYLSCVALVLAMVCTTVIAEGGTWNDAEERITQFLQEIGQWTATHD